ncbi:MAG: N-acetyl-gamma-glutamyl-phosphate reductase [Kiritimatiellae bacterium]|nr:N-acetyl-gamma-glutamyl-phosphate reductase [Kiritimatiellia bacterium]MDW8459237.1 N-acetyl-gamma-glutamyl-phosphate reductase [Verrucomicrobiota bacterium]
MITAKIIGAGGYGGVGITELLLGHPEVKIRTLVAAADTGMKMSELYPHLDGFIDLPILKPDDPAAQEPADVVFFATPDGVGMTGARAELEKGARVIDYSGDFRFQTPEEYAEYARRLGKPTEHKAPDLLPLSVYAVPELRRSQLNGSVRLAGNPGCFAVGVEIGLAPAVAHKLVELDSLICDCKSAVSGAGKKPNPSFHYPARYDNMNAYRLTGHQHVVEVERELSRLAGQPVAVTFTTQVVPACRGILSCLYGELRPGIGRKEVMDAYRDFHKGNIFVRIYDRNAAIGTAHVRGSNYCNLIVDVDERTNKLRVISHIDNLMKGQAGNALQTMNLLFGFPETMGLDRPGQYP